MIQTRLTTKNGEREIVTDRAATQTMSFAADSPTHLVRVTMNNQGGLIVNTSRFTSEGKWVADKSIYFATTHAAPRAAAPRKSHSVEMHDATEDRAGREAAR